MSTKARLSKIQSALRRHRPETVTPVYQDPDTGLYKITVHDDNGTHEELVTLEELRRLRDPVASNSILILVNYDGPEDTTGT